MGVFFYGGWGFDENNHDDVVDDDDDGDDGDDDEGVIQYDLAHILHPAFCCKPLLSSFQLLLPSHQQ